MNRLEIIRQHIDQLLAQKDRIIIAIDGKCTAGKTTLAAQLAKEYDCNLFHMDEFFLRPEQRTTVRYTEVGGNVDYERSWRKCWSRWYPASIFPIVLLIAKPSHYPIPSQLLRKNSISLKVRILCIPTSVILMI